MSYYDFTDKIALITGATSGIGNSIAENLYGLGCKLFCITSSDAGRSQLLKQFTGSTVIKCNFKNTEDQVLLIKELNRIQENIKFDILINCAGVFPLKSINGSTLEDFDNCFNVNVRSAFSISQCVGKNMCLNKDGRIVNIGSSSAYNGSEDAGIYCASKHALLGLTRSLYKEYRPHGVRVYSVSPGSCQTPMGETDKRQDFSTFITPDEVADVILDVLKFNGEGIMEEIRINRMVIR